MAASVVTESNLTCLNTPSPSPSTSARNGVTSALGIVLEVPLVLLTAARTTHAVPKTLRNTTQLPQLQALVLVLLRPQLALLMMPTRFTPTHLEVTATTTILTAQRQPRATALLSSRLAEHGA